MNRSQRRLHRGIFVGLAGLLPPLLFVALRSRPSMPGAAEVPTWLESPSGASLRSLAGGPSASLEVSAGEAAHELRLVLPSSWNEPDSLVYWSDGSSPEGDAELPPRAHLLGAPDGRPVVALALPPDASTSGILWIYSPARSKVLARVVVVEGVGSLR